MMEGTFTSQNTSNMSVKLTELQPQNAQDAQISANKVDVEKIIFTPSQEKILRKFFCLLTYKRTYKKSLKKAKVRLMIINELVKTEETYVSKLKLVNTNLKVKMSNILQNENDIQKLFNNIEQIQKLSEEIFLKYLKDQTVNLRFNSKVFNAGVLQIIPFFKIYSDYLQQYEESIKFLGKLMETRKDIKDMIEQFESDENESVQSLLITPVQRLPRYRLLFTELANKTPPDHQDFASIKKCLSEFQVVCTQVNASIQKYLDNQKIFELTVSFKGNNLQIIEKRREFIFEERLTLINEGEKNCIVSFLNDLILVQERIDEENTKPLCWAFLNSISQVKSCEDMKYYKDIFKVSGVNNILTFMAENKEQKMKLIEQIQQLITNNRQRETDLDNIEVNILGTEEWNTTKIKKFTVYVAEIKILNVQLKIWVRYSQLVQIEKKVKNYTKDIHLHHLNTAFTWLSNNRTKTIENRKIQFEQFLKKVLTMKEIKNSPVISTILSDLGLPKEFYDLPYRASTEIYDDNDWTGLKNYESDGSDGEDSEEQKSNGKNLEKSSNGKNLEKSYGKNLEKSSHGKNLEKSNGKNLEKSNFQANFNENSSLINPVVIIGEREKSLSQLAIGKLSASESFKLHRYKNMKLNRQSYSGRESILEGDRCLLDIEFLDKSSQSVEISAETRCFSVCQDIAKKIGLKCSLDYRLFLKDSRGNFRVLDDDEILFKTLFPQEKSLQQNAQLISQPLEASCSPNIQPPQNLTQSNSSPSNGTQNLESSSHYQRVQSMPVTNEIRQSQLWQYSQNENVSKNMWQKFIRAIRQSEKYSIVFKKYLWLSPEQEEFDIRQDPVRLRLICYQIFENVKQQKYKFSFNDYSLLAALYLYIQHNEMVKNFLNASLETSPSSKTRDSIKNPLLTSQNCSNFPFDKIKEILPEIIFNSKEEQFWIQQTTQKLESLSSEIDKIEQKNRDSMEVSKVKDNITLSQMESKLRKSEVNKQQQLQSQSLQNDSPIYNSTFEQSFQITESQDLSSNKPQKSPSCSLPNQVPLQSDTSRSQTAQVGANNIKIAKFTSKQILSEKIKLMQLVVINAIKDNLLFGVSQFYVNTYKDTLKVSKELNLNIQENAWLGIKHDMIYLLGPEFKEVLIKFTYDQLSSKRVFPKQIHLTLSNINKDLKFITSQSFEISQLVSEYQSIVSLLKQPAFQLQS